MSRQTYSAKELGEALGVSESKAYEYIRQMNAELTQKGFLTVRGKVSRKYANERFFGGLMQDAANE
nr:MAG TPA: DNA binding protein [Caudoviricetes sp.]